MRFRTKEQPIQRTVVGLSKDYDYAENNDQRIRVDQLAKLERKRTQRGNVNISAFSKKKSSMMLVGSKNASQINEKPANFNSSEVKLMKN